jgi:hypothetical protein
MCETNSYEIEIFSSVLITPRGAQRMQKTWPRCHGGKETTIGGDAVTRHATPNRHEQQISGAHQPTNHCSYHISGSGRLARHLFPNHLQWTSTAGVSIAFLYASCHRVQFVPVRWRREVVGQALFA